MKDSNNRTIKYMRLSVTDMCNFRCSYCMPEDYDVKTHNLSLEHIELISKNLNKLGITKVKLTGGEPLVRNDICDIVRVLKEQCHIEEVTLTTNGVLLDKYLDSLVDAGLDAITISIDTLRKDDFNQLVKREQFDRVIENIKLAVASPIQNIKLNCVPLKHLGDDNLLEIIKFADDLNIPIRFIEMMPIGLGRKFPGYDQSSLIKLFEAQYGTSTSSFKHYGNGPATYLHFERLNIEVGFISAISNKFCGDCNRIRVTSTGHLKQCLHYNYNIDLVETLQTSDGLASIRNFILGKPKEHTFTDLKQENIETLTMSEIGG
ncbi:GTP 3',8-cyclase MoaA [Mollicutes bacterium LVI A0039]|nr:GTP 3',8-cyclase MoaA [Mollicutes bacterium LVI A0039]